MTAFVRRIVGAVALLAWLSSAALASDFVVTKTTDSNDGSCTVSTCSLRDAIIAANNNAGADRVILGSGLTYTLTLGPADAPGAVVPGSGDLDITDALTIEGNGSTIDAGGLDRALHIQGTFSVTINNLTITKGLGTGFLTLGAGIYIKSATVTLNNCVVTGNATAAGGFNGSTPRGAGGGIAVVGTFNAATGVATPAVLTLNNTTVTGNAGSNGGGVDCILCHLIAANTTVTANTASVGDGAGIAIYGNASSVLFTGGTFKGNAAAGRGGALALPVGTGTATVTRARFLSNAAPLNTGMFDAAATVTAINNWWGCNYGPGVGGAGCLVTPDDVSAAVVASPYLVLQSTQSSASVNPVVADTVTAQLNVNSDGVNVSSGGTVQDGIPVSFATTLGNLSQTTALTSAGLASTVLAAGPAGGSATVSVTVDNQTVTDAAAIVLPQVSVDHGSLQFAATAIATAFTSVTAPQVVHLTQSGLGPVAWTATSDQPWLVVSPASGSGSATLTISAQFVPGLASTQAGSITLMFTGTANSAGPIGVTLSTLAAPAAPFGSFDSPADGSTGLSGSIAVTGWALDDVQVTSVGICRDAAATEAISPDTRCDGQPKVFIGNAVFIDGARPDIQAQFPSYPLNSRGGWGYLLLTNFLPGLGNGAYTLYAYANDADGHTTLLGWKTIACANSASSTPFGAIDTPAQGETIGGSSYVNFGWVLSPAPAFADPPDGGTVSVFVDGTNVGSPGGWAARADLTALFPAPQFPGVDRALGVYGIDTTAFADGLHTLAWIVTSNTGTTAGVGSRFITIANGSLMVAPSASAGVSVSAGVSAAASFPDVDGLPEDDTPIAGRRGFDASAPLQDYAATSGTFVVQAEELERIELHLAGAKNRRYSGYMRTPSGLTALPAGSQLDPETGVFAWQTAAGFLGAYDLVFTESGTGAPAARVDVRIVLNPKRSDRVGPQTVIDAPAQGVDGLPATVNAGGFAVTGWAADFSSTADDGVDVVHVWAYRVDAGAGSDPIFLGPAPVNGSRPDVGAVYGARFAKTGYGLLVNSLSPGTYDIAVFAFSTVTHGFAQARTVRVIVR